MCCTASCFSGSQSNELTHKRGRIVQVFERLACLAAAAPELQHQAAALLLQEVLAPQAGQAHCKAAMTAAGGLPLQLLLGEASPLWHKCSYISHGSAHC